MKKRLILPDLALTEDMDIALFNPQMLDLTSRIAKEASGDHMPEQGGYFGGILIDRKFYIFDHEQTGKGDLCRCVFYDDVENPLMDKFLEIIVESMPDYRTIVYHSHPRIDRDKVKSLLGRDADALIDTIRTGLANGVYEHCGIKNIDDALNEEIARRLSEGDVRKMPGRYNLVLSNTPREGDPFAHLNLYDIKRGLPQGRCLKTGTYQKTEVPWLAERFEQVVNRYKKEVYGAEDLTTLGQGGLQRAFLMNQGYLSPGDS